MNRFMLAILALSCVAMVACSKSNPASQSPPIQPRPVAIEPAPVTTPPVVSQGELKDDPFAPFGEDPQPVEPAPAAPAADDSTNTAEGTDAAPLPPEESASAAEVMDSVGRVLRRTIGADKDEAEAKGSIFRSIGRAFTKGAEAAASGQSEAQDE
jgi:hypothetical protein